MSATPTSPTKAMAPRDIVAAFYDAYRHGDLERCYALFAEDVHFEAHPSREGAALCGVWTGTDGLRDRQARSVELFELDYSSPELILAEGSSVAVRCRVRGAVRETDTVVDTTVAHFFEVRDGKIAVLREVFDTQMFEAALNRPARSPDNRK